MRVWDIVGREWFETRIEHDAAVVAVACSSDSTLIVSGSWDRTVKIHNAQTGDLLRTIYTDSQATLVRFQTRDRIMYTTADSKFAIWDLTKNENELLFELDGYKHAISSDGKSVATSDSEPFVKLWQADLDQHCDQDSNVMKVTCIAFSGDGQLVASGFLDGTVKVWDATSGLCLHTLRAERRVTCVTFSPDSRFCASASQFDMIWIWDVHTGTLFSIIGTDSNVIRFSPDGSQLLSFCNSSRLTLWEVETGELLAETKLEGRFRRHIAFGVDATSVVLQTYSTAMRWQISPAPSFNYEDDNWDNYPSLPLVFIPIHDDHQSTSPAVAPCQYDYDDDGGWISDRQGRQVFWVLPDRRGEVDRYGEKFVIGSRHGKVTFVDLSDVNVECPV
jgi:WD40 repeat protein